MLLEARNAQENGRSVSTRLCTKSETGTGIRLGVSLLRHGRVGTETESTDLRLGDLQDRESSPATLGELRR